MKLSLNMMKDFWVIYNLIVAFNATFLILLKHIMKPSKEVKVYVNRSSIYIIFKQKTHKSSACGMNATNDILYIF